MYVCVCLLLLLSFEHSTYFGGGGTTVSYCDHGSSYHIISTLNVFIIVIVVMITIIFAFAFIIISGMVPKLLEQLPQTQGLVVECWLGHTLNFFYFGNAVAVSTSAQY